MRNRFSSIAFSPDSNTLTSGGADVNADGLVNILDLTLVAAAF